MPEKYTETILIHRNGDNDYTVEIPQYKWRCTVSDPVYGFGEAVKEFRRRAKGAVSDAYLAKKKERLDDLKEA